MALGLASASVGVSLTVAVLAILFAFLAAAAARRRANKRLNYVTAAFCVFALKNVFSAYTVWTHAVRHDAIELVLSVLDLVLMALLLVPFLLGRRS